MRLLTSNKLRLFLYQNQFQQQLQRISIQKFILRRHHIHHVQEKCWVFIVQEILQIRSVFHTFDVLQNMHNENGIIR